MFIRCLQETSIYLERKEKVNNHKDGVALAYSESFSKLNEQATGDCTLNQYMLPFFAASRHTKYAKCAHVYLQTMLELPGTHPDLHQKIKAGFHVVRRSDRYWAGLSTDIIIQQVFMCSMKTHGGLTRGRGMTEIQRLVWFISMSACVNVTEAMQKLTGMSQNDSLFNIAIRMTAQQVVNVEISRIIGERILASMIGKTVEEFHFSKR